jgi:hypothetical protein
MPATKITDLLPIPKGTRQPHAYQVFGLEDGEQDSAKIADAVKQTIARLKASKDSTDAKLWAKAAKLAQDARVVLADPAKKTQLDARFGIISIEDEPPPAALQPVPQVADPLASVLPSSDPLASVLPPANPLAPIAPVAAPAPPTPQVASPDNVMPAGVFGTPATDAHVAGPTSVAPAAPVFVKPKKSKRRKSSILTTLMFSTFAIAMLALIGALIYSLVSDRGIAITEDAIKFTTKPSQSDGTAQVSPPTPVAEQAQRPPIDPVMGDLAGDTPPPTRPEKPSGLATALQSSNPPADSDTSPMVSPPDQPQPGPSPLETEPAMEPMTDEMIADAEKALDRVRTLIREAKWGEMKVAAESMLETRMSQEQTAESEALYELADLATYYRGAIERAVAELNVGNDFAVTDSFRVIVVEKGEDLLVVRYSEKNRSFTFDEFPFSLAHRLATFSTKGDSATTQASKAAYQAIAPKATDAHRAEAVTWLREITGEVEGADPKRMADTIESLFGE